MSPDQAQRHLTVMSLLDVTLDQWETWLAKADLDSLPSEISDPIAQMIYSLRNPDEPESPQLYMQTIAMLNDENLLKIVEIATGKGGDT